MARYSLVLRSRRRSAGPGRRDRGLRRGTDDEPARVMKEGDFKQLVGHWTGSSNVQGELSSEIEGMINEDGSFWIAERRVNATQAPGTMKIVDGGVQYDAAKSQGKMTFHESSTAWTWNWQGVTKEGGRRVSNQLTKSK